MVNNTMIRTMRTAIVFSPGGERTLKNVGLVLGHIRGRDYTRLVQYYREHGKKKSKLARRQELVQEFGISKREADHVIYSNDAQLDLVLRTTKENIKEWGRDIRSLEKKTPGASDARKHFIHNDIRSLEARIRKHQAKSPSCCFGGSRLQRELVRHPGDNLTQEDWMNKRLFLEFMGETGRVSGNPTIRVKNNEVSLHLSKGLAELCCIQDTDILVGRINPKYYTQLFRDSVENNKCVSYQFLWDRKKRKWRVHISLKLVKPALVKDSGYSCGIDQNSGFINVTIVDKHANPVGRREFHHSHSKDMRELVNDVFSYIGEYSCSRVSIEKLRGLSGVKRGARSRARGLNRVVNKIPYGRFKECLMERAEIVGVRVVEVSPYHTSRNTVDWGESRFGLSVHDKASYLIARRGLGLSIDRRVKKSPQGNGVCSGEGCNMMNNHDCSTNHDSMSFSCVCSVGGG